MVTPSYISESEVFDSIHLFPSVRRAYIKVLDYAPVEVRCGFALLIGSGGRRRHGCWMHCII